MKLDTYTLLLTVAAGLSTLAVAYQLVRSRRKQRQLSSSKKAKTWRPVAKVSRLDIFPIKSCHGVEVLEADCTLLGLKRDDYLRDRCLMIVGESDNFLNARNHPKLVLVQPMVTGNCLKLEAPDMPTLKVTIPDSGKQRTVTVWGEQVSTLDCGAEAAAWLSQYLFQSETGARLVYHQSEKTQRDARLKMKDIFPSTRSADGAAFHDLAPYHLLSEASLSDLNAHLPDGLSATIEHFRPTIVVSDCLPFAEDEWKFIKIGQDAIFRYMKPCDRCLSTTVDPETGTRNSNVEPLNTLKKYRQAKDPQIRAVVGESPFFGIIMALEKPGKIRKGDSVYAAD